MDFFCRNRRDLWFSAGIEIRNIKKWMEIAIGEAGKRALKAKGNFHLEVITQNGSNYP